ncbi:MAG: LacI family transcriptional regulator [Anaerolineae bacterium]|nr:LacI family transcriptional regulator [Anaerolineae bacterium]
MVYLRTLREREPDHDRARGFAQACETHGLVPLDIWRGEVEALEAPTLLNYLAAGATAIITENDFLADRTLALLGQHGQRCPADYSLAVLGDSLGFYREERTWTRFQIPRREMGQHAVQMLVRLLQEEAYRSTAPHQQMLECTFVPGTTVALPPEGKERPTA